MNPQILIPSCKDVYEISPMMGDILQCDHDADILYSCTKNSAAVNRNKCLDQATSEYVVMVDDDITGFFSGWHRLLIAPMINNDDIIYVSARLMNECGDPQMVIGFSKNTMSPTVEVNIAPSACIAFRNDGMRFHEGYRGSGFEDTDFHFELKKKYGDDKKVLVNNGVKLTHIHQMKNQNGIGEGFNPFEENKALFDKRHPGKRAMLGL